MVIFRISLNVYDTEKDEIIKEETLHKDSYKNSNQATPSSKNLSFKTRSMKMLDDLVQIIHRKSLNSMIHTV